MALFLANTRVAHCPEIIAIPNQSRGACLGIWMQAGAWCAGNSPDGVIPRDLVSELGATRTQVRHLVRVGLWSQHPIGFGMERGPSTPRPLWDVERTDYRKRIPRALRQRVYERDGYACVFCGSPDDLSVDHIYPWSRGGRDVESNLQTLCRPCNRDKGAHV